jgi:DNA-binding transcriptional LysR family regulator
VAGDALVRHARLILGQVEQMHGELDAFATGIRGRIKLLSNTAALAALLPQQIGRFLAAYPGLSVDIDERPSAEIVLAIAEGKADVGIVADIADLANLQTHFLAHDQLVVIANKTHRIAAQQHIAFKEIVDEAFVGLKDAALEAHLAERASRLGRRINYRMQLRSVYNLGGLVEAGIGIAILSKASLEELRGRDLAILSVSDPWASRQLHLCVRSQSSLSPHAQLLVQHLMTAHGRLPSGDVNSPI